jgi:putative MFS transporter
MQERTARLNDERDLLQRLTIDARLDRMDAWPWPWAVLIVLGASFLWAYFDINDLAATLPRAADVYGVGLGAVATAASLGLYGYIAGEVIASFTSDMYGRRPTFLVAMFVVAAGSLVNGLAPTITAFDILRFISGMGIGASIAVISTYLSELAPARIRGKFSAWGVFPALVGLAAATVIAYGLVIHVNIGWRLMLMIPVLGIISTIAAIFLLPESPRWLAEKGRMTRAEALVAQAEDTVTRRTGRVLPPPVPQPVKLRPRYPFFALLRPPQLKWTLLMFGVWFSNYLPVYSATIGITVLTKLGYTLETSILLSLAGAAGGLAGALIAPHITDRWNRKYPAMIVSLLACLFYVLVAIKQDDVTIGLAFGFANFQIGIFAPLIYTATAEHFPTETRTMGIGIADGIGHVGGAVGPTVSSAVFAAFSASGYFVFLGSFFALTAVMLSMAKNTAGRTLEDLRAAARGTVTERPLGTIGLTEPDTGDVSR